MSTPFQPRTRYREGQGDERGVSSNLDLAQEQALVAAQQALTSSGLRGTGTPSALHAGRTHRPCARRLRRRRADDGCRQAAIGTARHAVRTSAASPRCGRSRSLPCLGARQCRCSTRGVLPEHRAFGLRRICERRAGCAVQRLDAVLFGGCLGTADDFRWRPACFGKRSRQGPAARNDCCVSQCGAQRVHQCQIFARQCLGTRRAGALPHHRSGQRDRGLAHFRNPVPRRHHRFDHRAGSPTDAVQFAGPTRTDPNLRA